MRTIALALFLVGCGGTAVVAETPADTPADAPAADAPAADAVADATHDDTWRHFGESFTTEDSTALASVLDSPENFQGQTIRTEGRISDVCQAMGCWLVLADGERTIRITAKDHGFGVDKDTTGMWGDLEGVVTRRELDPERVEHLRSESENQEAMPENNAEGGVIYEIEASAIRIRENT